MLKQLPGWDGVRHNGNRQLLELFAEWLPYIQTVRLPCLMLRHNIGHEYHNEVDSMLQAIARLPVQAPFLLFSPQKWSLQKLFRSAIHDILQGKGKLLFVREISNLISNDGVVLCLFHLKDNILQNTLMNNLYQTILDSFRGVQCIPWCICEVVGEHFISFSSKMNKFNEIALIWICTSMLKINTIIPMPAKRKALFTAQDNDLQQWLNNLFFH